MSCGVMKILQNTGANLKINGGASMFALTEIGKPLVNIELYGTDTHIPPIDKVRIMDEDSFEQFILEWLYGSKKDKYETISKIGGSGDKGRDIIASYSDGTKDYYQCKHYIQRLGQLPM